GDVAGAEGDFRLASHRRSLGARSRRADDQARRAAGARREDKPVRDERSRRAAQPGRAARCGARGARDIGTRRHECRARGAVARGCLPRRRGPHGREDRSVNGIVAVAMKELRQVRRDRRTLVILVVVPTFFLFLYGYALNFDIRNVRLAVEDRDQTQASREIVAAFHGSPYFDVIATTTSPAESSALIDRGDAAVLLVVPPGFDRDLRAGRSPALQIVIDGANANSATTILGYVTGVVRQLDTPVGRRPAVGLVSVEPRVWYNPELRSTVFLVPGLIAFIAMITAVISTALSIVREKEHGTIEQVRMAPLSTAAFITGKTLPYLALSQIGATGIVVA